MVEPGNKPSVAIWTETKWAFGRIANQIVNVLSQYFDIAIYDWNDQALNRRFFTAKEWENFDVVLSNSYIFKWYATNFYDDLPDNLKRKLCVLIHCPKIGHPQFGELVVDDPDLHYGGVSEEVCSMLEERLKQHQAHYVPIYPDLTVFKVKDRDCRKLERLGVIMANETLESYTKVKGKAMFDEISRRTGMIPVYINNRNDPETMYDDIDMLLCCSEFEGNPLGIFEAIASGVPVLSTKVGNVGKMPSILTFNNASEAVELITSFKASPETLADYRERLIADINTTFNAQQALIAHLKPWLESVIAVKEHDSAVENPIDKPDQDVVDVVETDSSAKNNIRLHILGIPHTITNDKFSHCAFTGKVLRFPTMMQSQGYEVYHYGVEGSTTTADKNIDIFTLEEWKKLRIQSVKFLNPELTIKQCKERLKDKTKFVGDLAQADVPLYKEFNKRLRFHLGLNYRDRSTDIVCLPFGKAHEPALLDMNYVTVETGIGYPESYVPYRVFESYAWLHHQMGLEKKLVQNYWFVVPNYYDLDEWRVNLKPQGKTIGYFGRISQNKGLEIIVEIAKRMPDVQFTICGQGDPSAYRADNITYLKPLSGKERSNYLGNLTALLAPSLYLEPFCGVAVEAQICGTPVITHDAGAMTETVEHGKTGINCHTIADFCYGIRLALAGEFDREYIAKRAADKYGMFNVAKKYDYVFKCINDVHNGVNGYLGPDSHLASFTHSLEY